MRKFSTLVAGVLGAGVALAGPAVQAQTTDELSARIKALREELAQQRARVDALEREIDAVRAAPAKRLDSTRGTGPAAVVATAAADPAGAAVGQAPPSDGRPPEVAPLFEQPGVLTPRGQYVIEPALQFGYSSSNRVALVGYTIIPALLIGLVDVREVKRNTTTASMTVRRGLTNRLELELKVPYVYRSDATVSREIFTGTAVENVFQTSGQAIGDVELAGRYQINNGGVDQPYFIGGLRFKSRTGRDPFEVVTDCTTRCIGTNATGTGLPLDLPTGSGFYSLQPSLTWLLPSDPGVFFGTFSYLHNFKRDNVYRTVLSGEQEPLGQIKPGDVFGFNFGMGLALNDKASLSLGYDHSSIARTYQAGQPVPGSVRTQLGNAITGIFLPDQREAHRQRVGRGRADARHARRVADGAHAGDVLNGGPDQAQ